VEPGHGVVGEERVGPPDEREMVAQILGRLGEIHGSELVAGRNALVEGGEDAHPQAAHERGLPDEEQGEGGAGVHLGAREETDLLELLGAEQMRLVNDEDDPSPDSDSSAARRAWATTSALKKRGVAPSAETIVT